MRTGSLRTGDSPVNRCEFDAEDTDVRAEATLNAGEAERGLDEADAADPDAERDWF